MGGKAKGCFGGMMLPSVVVGVVVHSDNWQEVYVRTPPSFPFFPNSPIHLGSLSLQEGTWRRTREVG